MRSILAARRCDKNAGTTTHSSGRQGQLDLYILIIFIFTCLIRFELFILLFIIQDSEPALKKFNILIPLPKNLLLHFFAFLSSFSLKNLHLISLQPKGADII